jgi:oligopeptidase B
MRDKNWREVMRNPSRLRADIREYLEAENAWTRRELETPTEPLRDALFEEMKARICEDEASVPLPDGPWAYYRRFRKGGEYPLIVRRPTEKAFTEDGDEEVVLLDVGALGRGGDYLDVRTCAHSPDHTLIAYSVDETGSEFYTIRFRRAGEERDLDERVETTYGDFVWGEDSGSIYWVARDEAARPVAVYRRRLGEGRDELVYREEDPAFFVGVERSRSGRFIVITSANHTTSEHRFFPSDADHPEPRVVSQRETGVEYSVSEFADRLWILTNEGGAVDFRIVSAPLETPDRESWREEVAPRPGVLILELESFRNHLARLEREDGLPRIVITNRFTGAEHAIAFDEQAYHLSIVHGVEYDSEVLRFEYSSPATPARIVDYNMATAERVLRKQQLIPSGHDCEAYIVERVEAPAPDGAMVPVTLLRHRSTPVDGSASVLLYGYGAYGLNLPADFRSHRLSLVDRGFIFAVADVRGSMAKGYQWYLDGKLAQKPNTFSDFLAAGRHLIDRGYTSTGRIIAMGGSAGGLLVGAAVNEAPDLFGGVIAAVPFVDVLNTMSDETLPLTPPEWPEWGDPIRDESAYDLIASYAPYEQTRALAYPPILITGGLADPRVTYWEPAKWIARLRFEAPDAGPYYLRMNMEAGHAGASGRYSSLQETALEFAFAIQLRDHRPPRQK